MRSLFSRRLLAGLQLSLLVLVSAGLATTIGCSSFHKKKKPIPVEPSMTPPSGDQPGSTTPPPGPDDVNDHPTVGSLRPFPELQVIYFDYDKANIKSDQMARVENNLKYLKDHPNDKVLISGHCDERGTVEYNFSLGEKRASAIRDYYVKGGIAFERLAILSKGEEEPVDPGNNEAAFVKNRRAEFQRMF